MDGGLQLGPGRGRRLLRQSFTYVDTVTVPIVTMLAQDECLGGSSDALGAEALSKIHPTTMLEFH
jgi:hypothetical protein